MNDMSKKKRYEFRGEYSYIYTIIKSPLFI